jgi:hypothetical protein
MRRLRAALLVLLAFGCSILDPGDRDELVRKIELMPSAQISTLKKLTLNANALDWLQNRPDTDQVGKLQCRMKAGGTWSDWADQEPTYTVADMWKVLLIEGTEVTYTDCPDYWLGRDGKAKESAILHEQPVPGVTGFECRFVWDFRYEPEKVPPNLTDSKVISTEDIIEAIIGLPAPPPGWAFPELVPLLCPLGAGPGWGCPPNPNDLPGDQPAGPTGGGSGDYQ